ncbi:MAG: hypothetical protein JSW67_07710 [Candidatus Latescibacterota bacterium]|nr:MAG: hypothetical protein JSW67_07710 [Candidatus Latescibacterota bacterium]
MSACYKNSRDMSCATCHDPHQKESGDFEVFSRRCQKCHKLDDCAIADMGSRIGHNCVECHMAKNPVIGGVLRSSRNAAPILMWDHFIKARIPNSQQALRDFRGD